MVWSWSVGAYTVHAYPIPRARHVTTRSTHMTTSSCQNRLCTISSLRVWYSLVLYAIYETPIYLLSLFFAHFRATDTFAEVLTYQSHIYGTSISSIRDVGSSVSMVRYCCDNQLFLCYDTAIVNQYMQTSTHSLSHRARV